MYEIVARNRQGTGHRRRSLPCQDRFLAKADAGGVILVACDGHGGEPYTRSGLGARIMAGCAASLGSAGELPGRDQAAELKDKYDRLVRRHLKLRPLADWERERLAGRPEEEAYGTTFVCAILTEEGACVYQLGDGGVFLLDKDGRFLPPLPPDPDCVGSGTSSMSYSREDCLSHFRFCRYPKAAAAFVFTDGCGFSGPAPWEAAALLLEPEALNEAVDNLLHRADRGDDQTFLLAYDQELLVSPSFRAGVEVELALGKEAVRRLAAEAQLAELVCYLKLAAAKIRRMEMRHDPGLAEFKALIRPKAQAYLDLRAALYPPV